MRGGRALFQNVSVSLQSGDVLHVQGDNGAGKTSLLRILGNALPASGGIVKYNGADIAQMRRQDYAQCFSFMPADDRALKLLETVGETLCFWAGIYNVTPTRIDAALSDMGLGHLRDARVQALSSGQRRRLSLARHVMRDVPLWLVDEPLNALDDHARAQFHSCLARHTDHGGMAVIASHQPLAALPRMKVLTLHAGRKQAA